MFVWPGDQPWIEGAELDLARPRIKGGEDEASQHPHHGLDGLLLPDKVVPQDVHRLPEHELDLVPLLYSGPPLVLDACNTANI